jgi:hypothetical protein
MIHLELKAYRDKALSRDKGISFIKINNVY